MLRPDLRKGCRGWPQVREQEAAARQGIGLVRLDDPLGARFLRGGPTIACPVTAACSEHPGVVLTQQKAMCTQHRSPMRCLLATLLVGNRPDAGRRIDHGLLVVCDEAATGPIKIKDHVNDADDEQTHDVSGQPGAPRFEYARIT